MESSPAELKATLNAEVSSSPLWKGFLVFLGPMMLTNVLQSASGTINNMFLGQMLGVHAVAALSSFFPVLFLLISFTIGLGSGATVLIGQAYGAREFDRMKAVAGTTFTVSGLLGVVIAIFGGAFTESMLRLTGTPLDILPDAVVYARIFLFSLPLLFLYLIYTTVLRGVGDTMTPLLALILSTGVGIVLTPALIQGWAGLPKLGIASAAWAGTASFLTTLIAMSVYLLWRKHPLAPDRVMLKHLAVDWGLLKTILRIGVPTGIQVVLISLAEIAVLSFVNAYGSDATAAYGAVNQIASYVQFPAISIAIAASIFGAQTIGRGRVDRLGAITQTGLVLNLIITGFLVLAAYLFSRTVIGLIITDPKVVDLAQALLHITLWSYVVYGAAAVISGVMRASGTVFWPMAISIFAICGIEVPVAYVLSHRMGIDGVWIAYPVAFIVMLGMQAAYYRFVWRKKTITRLI